ncbi:MAG: hypothetical protein FWG28_05055 [Clostridiales bacterium]|nr:hypothetical protein [Clostridiales bacterium]
MSDTIFKIFPRYYYPTYPDEKIIGAMNALKLTCPGDITFINYGGVQFIDCGDGLEHIFCPWCGCKVNMEFWQVAMDTAYQGDSFKNTDIRMPCCDLASSLEELIYVKPCGFATFVIEILNPTTIPCKGDLHEMGKCFGNPYFFRMISAHI